jgi:hypothetical protein
MKFVIVTLAVVFNLTLVVLYSRGLVGGSAAREKTAKPGPVAERSASAPYRPVVSSEKKSARPGEGAPQDAGAALDPVESRDGKETVDPKDGKELVQPVAEEVRPLRLRSGQARPSTEIMGRSERGILGPANRANVDPPVVSPEAR